MTEIGERNKLEFEQMRSEVERVVMQGLQRAKEVHDNLGMAGLEEVAKNQYGDTALRADIEIEKVVLDTLHAARLPIRVFSEEHGVVEIGDNPQYVGVLDGIDGTFRYKLGPGQERYGTMFGILETTDPCYDQYVTAGIMEHASGRFLLASHDKGSRLVIANQETPLHTFGRTSLDPDTRIYIDETFTINRTTFSQNLQTFSPKFLRASSVYYIDVVSGDADLALECTRKGNLELAVAYGLIKEAGGVMVTLDGVSLGSQRYLEFGQQSQIPVITAATPELAQALIEYLRQKNSATP